MRTENQIKNLPEFKKLIERYETITIDEIDESNLDINVLTGFGSCHSCNLCKGAGYPKMGFCFNCVWGEIEKVTMDNLTSPCFIGKNKRTYNAIDNADSTEELLTAYRNRAKHMRSILKKLNIEMP